MREDGTDTHGFRGMQTRQEPRHIFLIETQTMHAGVYLDMNRHVLQAFRLSCRHHSLQRLMAIDIRLQVILENQIHRSNLRIHDDDG